MAIKVIFDTETTGLSFKKDRVLEIAALKFDDQTKEMLGTLHLLINPEKKVPAEAAAVHGLTNEILADKPKFIEVVDQIIEFMEGTDGIAHNAAYDVGMLNAEFERASLGKFEDILNSIFCTVKLSRKVDPGRRATLDAICERYSIDKSKRVLHGALIDCELLMEAYFVLKEQESRIDNILFQILGFNPEEAFGQMPMLELGRKMAACDAVKKLFGAYSDRFSDEIERRVAGEDYEEGPLTVKHSEGVTTDWKKITEDYLQNVDLTPYQTEKKTVRVKFDLKDFSD